MDITITVTDAELTAADKTIIKECLGLASDATLNAALKKLSKAAFMEYVKMFKERGLPTRANEVQQERLFFLLNHYFIDRLPGENEISSIFQVTPSQSKTLLRNTKSRFRTKIEKSIDNTLLQTLKSATQREDEGPYEFVCTSQSTIEELNSIVGQKGPTLEPIKKIKDLANKYICAVDTYNLLMKELS
ncbi:MAG TPA: hypothetical protein VLX91_09140 [Candidatus Acidoferrales bacterium]|nr:hypothetical protein [Candidatus Acidoferrales bacterium]